MSHHDNQGGGGGGGGGRYSNRQYQPYVFRPNFMKNQDGERKQYGRKVIDWTGACAQTMLARRFKRAFKAMVKYSYKTIQGCDSL